MIATSGRWVRRGNDIVLRPSERGRAAGQQGELGSSAPVVRRGDRGEAVSDLQGRLAAQGLAPGPIDGIFGALTEAAVRKFQAARGLTADGVVSAATWAALGGRAAPVPAAGTTGRVSLERVLAAMVRNRYVIYTEPHRLNIVGVRSANPQPNRFDDTINVFARDDAGAWTWKSNPATTDPGTAWLLEPMRVSGTAIVLPGQYVDSHEIGYHHRNDPLKRYVALVQRAPIDVVRDNDRDASADLDGQRERGVFGINIHRASSRGTSATVGEYSAGCQVFASADDFASFLVACQRHRALYGNRFTYTLLDEDEL